MRWFSRWTRDTHGPLVTTSLFTFNNRALVVIQSCVFKLDTLCSVKQHFVSLQNILLSRICRIVMRDKATDHMSPVLKTLRLCLSIKSFNSCISWLSDLSRTSFHRIMLFKGMAFRVCCLNTSDTIDLFEVRII